MMAIEIIRFVIKGELKQYNEKNEIETITIQKIYRNKKGIFELELLIDDDVTVSILDYIPIFEFSFRKIIQAY